MQTQILRRTTNVYQGWLPPVGVHFAPYSGSAEVYCRLPDADGQPENALQATQVSTGESVTLNRAGIWTPMASLGDNGEGVQLFDEILI